MDNNKQLKITVSAFGKFGNIINNPTSIIVSNFTDEFKKKYNIIRSEVLEVSAIACNNYVDSLQNDNILNIHFGVYDGSQEFNIEQFGYNQKDFGIPDMRGYKPFQECIDNTCKLDECKQTKININNIVENLQKQFPIKCSDDPGRYICNYIYYYSLSKSQKCQKGTSLFIHFPSFKTISQNIQEQFVQNLFETIQKLYQKDQLFQNVI